MHRAGRPSDPAGKRSRAHLRFRELLGRFAWRAGAHNDHRVRQGLHSFIREHNCAELANSQGVPVSSIRRIKYEYMLHLGSLRG